MTGASIVTGGLSPGDGLSLATFGLLTTFLASASVVVIPARVVEVQVVGELRASCATVGDVGAEVATVEPVGARTVEVV